MVSKKSLSPCVVPALKQKIEVGECVWTDSRAIKKITIKSRCIESGRLVLLSSEAREPPFSGIHYKAKFQNKSYRIGKDRGR